MNQEEYGPLLKTSQAEEYTIEIFRASRAEKAAGRKGLPVCVWGPAGIGKTEIPKMYANKYAKELFDGNIVYLPMAQIEEKAELQGLPELLESLSNYDGGEIPGSSFVKNMLVDGVIKEFLVRSSTVYATPSWIPQEDTHGKRGILVIDDMNRADSRIINSIMQLLQDGKLLGWSLPQEWEIYCTCNPDDGKYQVTPMDGAQMTRMVNFRQTFDEKAWVENWAIPTGIHEVAQNFVLTYPESVCVGERTNPRSFDKLFRLISNYLDLLKSENDTTKVVSALRNFGLMNVDQEPLQNFIGFITNGFGKLPSVEEILDPEFDLDGLHETLITNGQQRVDIIASIDTRILMFIKKNESSFSKYKEGARKWIKHPKLPAELRYNSTAELIEINDEISDAELAQVIFSRYYASM